MQVITLNKFKKEGNLGNPSNFDSQIFVRQRGVMYFYV